ncbi:tail fiber domain-containing protein [Secundilactobacillus kimchicus]|uniref:tail fiber domain-containing protein n=1 Tax=Secundilactobacillus kimchicus TaxID=528209 RepID=UPI0024A85A6D|nr:tail fiber domain-containing protein [Secundilactobacillus kimchicus]
MIIATGSVNIDENAKLAEEAQTNAEKFVKESGKKYESMLDGKITQSIFPPNSAGDTNDHQDGDMWIQVDQTGYDGVAQQMYIYSNGSWSVKQWDQQTLSVKTLSALTADLGTVNSGTLNSVEIYAKNLTLDVSSDGGSSDDGHNSVSWSGTVAEGMGVNFNHGLMHMNARHLYNGTYDATYIGPNDFKVRNTMGLAPYSGLNNRVDISDGSVIMNTTWNDESGVKLGMWNNGLVQTNFVKTNYITGRDQSDVYFHDTWGNTIGIHAGDVISHGHTLKSTLSSKRNISDFKTDEALAKINSANIRRWQYVSDDNSIEHIGPIVDDVNPIGDKKYVLNGDMIKTVGGETGFDQSNALSIAMAAIQELSRRNDELSLRVTQLEMRDSKC